MRHLDTMNRLVVEYTRYLRIASVTSAASHRNARRVLKHRIRKATSPANRIEYQIEGLNERSISGYAKRRVLAHRYNVAIEVVSAHLSHISKWLGVLQLAF
jgi:hypothetical protein